MSSRAVQPTELIAHIDGASRGNPGPAAYGVVVHNSEGKSVATLSKFIGETTNNVAEYQALLAALDYALQHGHTRLRVLSDSELLTRQIQGTYKVKSPDLKPLHARALELIDGLDKFAVAYLPREQNREADRLANGALDRVEARGDGAPGEVAREGKVLPGPRASEPLRTSATYRKGILTPHREIPLAEGEHVELEIWRKKPPTR